MSGEQERFVPSIENIEKAMWVSNFLLLRPHWSILLWMVSYYYTHSLFYFINSAIVALKSDILTFYRCKSIQVISGFNLKRMEKIARWQNKDISTIDTPPGSRHSGFLFVLSCYSWSLALYTKNRFQPKEWQSKWKEYTECLAHYVNSGVKQILVI